MHSNFPSQCHAAAAPVIRSVWSSLERLAHCIAHYKHSLSGSPSASTAQPIHQHPSTQSHTQEQHPQPSSSPIAPSLLNPLNRLESIPDRATYHIALHRYTRH
ncbi:hypothetical protein PCANC_02070 [Puccinia coronata f. sp. avenae]|uniref:Uncharacterized protein n=1 Tax=Puccinia coronata f. sp. avenae TaxID=200324 RepID=A0A2N5W1P5_9BASI|nr:hypothetical protein PCASD_19028 [Puccinia coronata f. sp. avenae]PLW17039.1 hypothetical protein PCANC_11881 [Puccinia coronata f. sp. avenae]PLW37393.1 hypothetical protein PCASD_09919 [Puccinia coronata f. sp. avenae]PLW56183.1 hypothetical protein PCANC_02070 [Puccinia coronata f. sp. avenae]